MNANITIKNNDLLTVFARAIKDVDPKSTMRVLSGLLLTVADLILSVTATNIQSASAAQYTIQGGGPFKEGYFSTVLPNPARVLKWLRVGRKKNADVGISVGSTDDLVFVRDGRKLTMVGIPAEEFPGEILKLFKKRPTKKIGAIADKAITVWGPHLYATASGDETRPYLNCICLRDGFLTSTDGHRMNHCDMTDVLDADVYAALPREAWGKLVRDCKPGKKARKIHLDMIGKLPGNKWVRISYGDCIRLIKHVDTECPPYKQIIPSDRNYSFTPNMEELQDVITEIKALATQDHLKTVMEPNGKGFKFKFDDPSGAAFEALVRGAVQRQKYEEDEEDDREDSRGFNIHKLKEALDPFEAPTMYLTDPLNGVVFLEEGNPVLHLLMPMRIK